MNHRFPDTFLWEIRNHVDIHTLITANLNLPSKYTENVLRFLCPLCHEFQTAVNPRTNLSRCFLCQKNFNPIDLVMAERKCSFLQAVEFLKPFLAKYRTKSA